jgi:hypothetical protein
VLELLLDAHHALAQLDLVDGRRLAETLLGEPTAMLVLMKSMSCWVKLMADSGGSRSGMIIYRADAYQSTAVIPIPALTQRSRP